jgi:plastocyanin
MAINQISTANTFQQWLIATQSLISTANSITDNPGGTFYANTNLVLDGDLTVTGNITLDEIGFNDLNVAGNIYASGFSFSANANTKTGVTTLVVTNSGSASYLFDQYSGGNPDVYLHPGQTIAFNLNSPGHPFLIRETSGGTLYNVGLTHVSTTGIVTTGADAQAKQSGTLIWKVPFDLIGNTYVYQCQVHSAMVGNLIIQNTVSAAFAAANTAAGDSLAFAIALG